MPPPGDDGPTPAMECVRKLAFNRLSPREIVYPMVSPSGSSVSASAPLATVVISRLTALRRPSTPHDSAVTTTVEATTAKTTKSALPASGVSANRPSETRIVAAAAVHGAHPG